MNKKKDMNFLDVPQTLKSNKMRRKTYNSIEIMQARAHVACHANIISL